MREGKAERKNMKLKKRKENRRRGWKRTIHLKRKKKIRNEGNTGKPRKRNKNWQKKR